MKSRYQICDMMDTRPSLKIPGTDIAVQPGNYNSSNVIYLIKCKRCDTGNYIGETITIFKPHMNNHKEESQTSTKDYQ